MNKKIIILNIIYYSIIIGLIALGRNDPSNSLGYGYFIIFFWIISILGLLFLLIKKIIHPKSLLEKFGTFTLTPVLSIIFILIFLAVKKNINSEYFFNKNGHYFKKIIIDDKRIGGRRIEYYKKISTPDSKATWIKDSSWFWISNTGDTIKEIKYSNDTEVKP